MNPRRTTALTVATSLVAIGLVACGDSAESGAEDGPLKIGIKYDQPGLGLRAGTAYKGFDIDIAKYVAKELGYDEQQIEFVEAPSKEREKMLANGTVTMNFATYSITDKRKAEIAFAGPYFTAGQSILVTSDSDITGVDDLADKRVCSVTGSTSVENLKKKQPNLVPLQRDKYSECADALVAGTIDAMTTDDAILAGYANQPQYKGRFKLVGGTFTKERYGVGLKRGDTETCEKVTAAIEKMVKSGAWEKALKDNLGEIYEDSTQVDPPTEFEACS